jgi:hypothetical protein
VGRPQKKIDPQTLTLKALEGKSQAQAAFELGVSEDTLRRRMRDRGTTWGDHKDRFRVQPKGERGT